MKACTGLWITAAIQRAVDDKTAKNLLGNTFKRQLKYDGQYNAVTFICTKTDDILETEVTASLNLEDEMGESWAQLEHLRGQLEQLREEVGGLKDQKFAVDSTVEDLDSQTDDWEELLSRVTDGETVYRPSQPKKRKRSSGTVGRRKRRSSIDSDSDVDDILGSDDAESDKENSQSAQEDRPPLTEEEVDQELAKFKALKRDLRKSRKDIDTKIAALKKQMAVIVVEKKALTSEVKSMCIKGRNEYSRAAIKKDFAMGIKE